MLRRVPKKLAHRWRTVGDVVLVPEHSRPFSSATNCCTPVCLPLRPTGLVNCWQSPLMFGGPCRPFRVLPHFCPGGKIRSFRLPRHLLHAALRFLHVAQFNLPFIARRASRCLVWASSNAALVSGFSHHEIVETGFLRSSSPLFFLGLQ